MVVAATLPLSGQAAALAVGGQRPAREEGLPGPPGPSGRPSVLPVMVMGRQ